MRNHSVSPQLFCVAVILGVQTLAAVPANGADKNGLMTTSALLKDAKETIAENSDKFILQHKAEALVAKLSILESQSDIKSALDRARSIKSPFYSSLALSGIAATEIPSDPSTSAKHFREALARSRDVKHWTGSHATGLGFMLELLPSYPKKESRELLKASKAAFDGWEGSGHQKSKALLSLSKATTAIRPEAAKGLLYDVALKSSHYWASIEYLATFMAQQSMKEALELSETHYTARKDWPNDQYFRRAVLIELAKTDFSGAFEEMKKMRKLDQEIAAVKLAEFLLGHNRKKDTQQVIAHIESLNSDFNWTQSSLKTLRSRLEQDEQVTRPSVIATPEAIDDFLKNPSAERLQFVSNYERVIFRDERQIRDFITASLPLVKEIRDMGYPHHGSPRSTALGLLVVCSALRDEIPEAVEISKRIEIPELRASYLLDAYEARNPIELTVSKWPIHFWQHKTVSILLTRLREIEKAEQGTVPDAVSGNLGTFHLKIYRIPTTKYEQSLDLHVQIKAGEPEAIALQISQAEASSLADALVSSDYFTTSIKPSGRWPDPKETPCYRIAVQTKTHVSYLDIGQSVSTLTQLQSLSGALENTTRKALDALCSDLKEELNKGEQGR